MKIEDYPLGQLVIPLLEWFYGHARVLPWREDAAPYRVWVSEIMLQQTRVEAVKPYFERFTKALPNVEALASCGEEPLLKLWEGLGYYNRVRNMQIAARQVMEDYGGRIPEEYEELLKLKGIGSYTAGAVASIAYGKPVPAVDGNVLRVLSRASADERDIMKQSVRTNMEHEIRNIIPGDAAGAFNQALMELGAMVCLPTGEPKCMECPWKEMCLARKEDKISVIPVKKKANARRIEDKTILLILDGERIVLKRRPQKGLLAGMYEFPNEQGYLNEKEALFLVKEMQMNPLRIESLCDAKHIFSHVEWHMKGYLIRVEALGEEAQKHLAKKNGMSQKEILFAEARDFEEKYPMPTAFAAYMKLLNIRLGKERVRDAE